MDPTDTAHRIKGVRALLEIKRAEVAELEKRLAELLSAAGRRTGPDDQQPALFEAARQPKLW